MTSEVLYFDSESYFKALRRELSASQESIDIEVYIWARDSFADEIFSDLVTAVKRGVRVRMIVDGIGSFVWIQRSLNESFLRGVEVHIYNRVHMPWMVSRWSKFNRRMHRKIFLIDGKILYTGSQNVMSEALEWRETGLRLMGPSLDLVRMIFEYNWKRTVHPRTRLFNSKRVRLYQSLRSTSLVRCNQFFRMRWHLHRDLIARIQNAKEKAWFATPYFNPPSSFLKALRKAAQRGVDVRLLLPSRSDVPVVRWIGQRYYRQMLEAGARIYEYQPRILHAKAAILDSWGVVGSSNLNHRSFRSDLEMDIVLSLTQSIIELEKQFEVDFEASKLVENSITLAFWKRILVSLFYRFRRWM